MLSTCLYKISYSFKPKHLQDSKTYLVLRARRHGGSHGRAVHRRFWWLPHALHRQRADYSRRIPLPSAFLHCGRQSAWKRHWEGHFPWHRAGEHQYPWEGHFPWYRTREPYGRALHDPATYSGSTHRHQPTSSTNTTGAVSDRFWPSFASRFREEWGG